MAPHTSPRHKWTENEINFLKENYKHGPRYCSVHLSLPVSKIYSKAKKLKLKIEERLIKPQCHIWTNDKIDFLKTNYNYGTKYCAEQLQFTREQVRAKAATLKLHVSKEVKCKNSGRPRPYQCHVNADFFINPTTKEAAYILGILWADGSLYNAKTNLNKIAISLVSVDMNIIKSIFDKSGAWTIFCGKPLNRQPQTTLSCSNKTLYKFLSDNDYEIKSQTTACKILNNISDELKNYFFRGYFDGDGCFYCNAKSHLTQMSCSGSYEQDWTFVTKLLTNIDVKHVIKRRIQFQRGQYNKSSVVRCTNRNDIRKFGNYIYGENYDEMGLKRKYNKFMQIVSMIKD